MKLTAEALDKAVKRNRRNIDLTTRMNVYDCLWFVRDLAHYSGNEDAENAIMRMIDAEENIDVSDILKMGTFAD